MLKALTVRQPWASLLVNGLKLFECRSWQLKRLGWYAIHAGAKKDHLDLCNHEFYHEAVGYIVDDVDDLLLGSILGMVRFGACHPVEEIRRTVSPQQIAFGEFESGYAWEVSESFSLRTPLKRKGKLSLWTVTDSDEAVLRSAARSWGIEL